MRARMFIAVAWLSVLGCGDTAPPSGTVDGSISGFVYLSGPVGGVVVTAYSYDPTSGITGGQIGQSAPTMPDGSFKVDLGIYFGSVLLVARGNGATFTEPTSGAQVTWDTAQALNAEWATWSPSQTLDFAFDRGAQPAGFVIGPWTHLANTVAHATAAAAPDFQTALSTALLLVRDHLESDFWTTQPTDLTEGASHAWAPPVALGLEASGFAELAARIATDSMTGGISSIDLLRVLEEDATDGVFDGRGPSGTLSLGTCMAECNLSGNTLRSDWSDSMAMFLMSTANKSTLSPDAVNDFLVRIANRQSPLFPANPNITYDVTPPTITVVGNTATDESQLQVSVVDATINGFNCGSPVFTGSTNTVSLDGMSVANFGRFASHYSPTYPGIPVWRFQIVDDHTMDADINVQVQLVNDDTGTVLVPWMSSPITAGAGFNHEITVSSALHSDLALISGNYHLDVQATDTKSNVSPITTVKWSQTILVPPVRQRPGAACVANTDPQCPGHYTLPSLSAAVPVNGIGLPGGEVRIGNYVIDNPNPIPLRVDVSVSTSATWSRGRAGTVDPFNNPFPSPPSFNNTCNPTYQLENGGACYVPPPQMNGEVVDANQSVGDLGKRFHAYNEDGSELLPCSYCSATQREIPAQTTINVWVTAAPFSFLWDPAFPLQTGVPALPANTLGGACEQWIDYVGGAPAAYCQTSWYLTRLAVTPAASSSLMSSPADGRTTVIVAPGTNTGVITDAPSIWNTAAVGTPNF